MLSYHAQEKEKATNINEMMSALEKEHKTYLHLHNDHGMAIYALDQSNGNMNLSLAASGANDIHNLGGMNHVQKAISHAIDHNIRPDNNIFDELKNSQGNIKILSEDLHRECTNHHINQVDRHLEDLSNNKTILIDNHRFSEPSKYLQHIKDHHNHSFVPINHINQQLQHIEHQQEQEMQKELNMHKNMGGHSL